VESGTADFGVVPIENSSEGTVNNTLDMFLTSPLAICGEVELRIHHNLMGAMSALGQVDGSAPTSRRSRSAAVGCREFARRRARAGRGAMPKARDARGTGRHGGDRADGRGRGLRPQRAGPEIEDRADNTTRFLVIGRKSFPPSGQDKTTLLVSAAHTDAPARAVRGCSSRSRAKASA